MNAFDIDTYMLKCTFVTFRHTSVHIVCSSSEMTSNWSGAGIRGPRTTRCHLNCLSCRGRRSFRAAQQQHRETARHRDTDKDREKQLRHNRHFPTAHAVPAPYNNAYVQHVCIFQCHICCLEKVRRYYAARNGGRLRHNDARWSLTAAASQPAQLLLQPTMTV